MSQWSVKPHLAALAARLPSRPLTRFAPAPTGYLHLGHVVNALYVWGLARALNGRVLLRIEDHAVRGFAVGVAAHGIGTARAFQVSESMGAFAGLAMGLNGLVTAFLFPVLVRFFG